jgi:hypothetical protein
MPPSGFLNYPTQGPQGYGQDMQRNPEAMDEREIDVEPQIVGHECKICRQKIVFFDEGKSCPRCGTFVHNKCLPQGTCDVCHQPWRLDEHLKPAPVDTAFDSHVLHDRGNDTLMLAVSLLISALLLGTILFCISYSLNHLHGK